jgi:hypothetical protein
MRPRSAPASGQRLLSATPRQLAAYASSFERNLRSPELSLMRVRSPSRAPGRWSIRSRQTRHASRTRHEP